MVEYSEQEERLITKVIGFYRSEVIPDEIIDKYDSKNLIAALDYAHSRGRFMRTRKQHDVMDSILEKNGVVIESNAARQARLKKERVQAIYNKHIDNLASIELEKKEALDVAVKNKENAKEAVKNAELKEKAISDKEARAKIAQEKAENIAKEQADEIARLKEELAKKKDINYLAEAAKELAKEDEATLIVDPPTEVVTIAPPGEPEEPPEKKEKTVDELIEDLKTDE